MPASPITEIGSHRWTARCAKPCAKHQSDAVLTRMPPDVAPPEPFHVQHRFSGLPTGWCQGAGSAFYRIHNAASANARKNTMNTSSVSLAFVFTASSSIARWRPWLLLLAFDNRASQKQFNEWPSCRFTLFRLSKLNNVRVGSEADVVSAFQHVRKGATSRHFHSQECHERRERV